MNELTPLQIARQDYVDNKIHELINNLNPSGHPIKWNIEMISDIRNAIRYWLVDHYKITDEESYYPYL